MSTKTVTASLEGDVAVEAIRRVVELSAKKYFTVAANLASGVARIHHAFILRDAAGDEHYGEVVVTGPYESPDGIVALPVARDR